MSKVKVSEKINYLFDEHLKPDGKCYTYQEVSDSTGLTVSHIWRLRNKKIKSPNPETLEKLRVHFGAPSDYFHDLTHDEVGEFEDKIVMRSRQLTKKGRAILLQFLDGLVEMQSNEE